MHGRTVRYWWYCREEDRAPVPGRLHLFKKNFNFLKILVVLGLCSCAGFSLVVASEGLLSSCMQCMGFSLQWRALEQAGFSSCGTWARSGCGSLWLWGTGSIVEAHRLRGCTWDLP